MPSYDPQLAAVGIPQSPATPAVPTPATAMNSRDLYALALGKHLLGNPQLAPGLFGAQAGPPPNDPGAGLGATGEGGSSF